MAGAKLIVIIGHTKCGAVTAAVNLAGSNANTEQATGCQHLEPIIQEIQLSMDPQSWKQSEPWPEQVKADLINAVARQNVFRTVKSVLQQSRTINQLAVQGRLKVVGAMYDIDTGKIEFFLDEAAVA
jgi:carbonic anhydrase/SulP family sulfate permease